MGGLLVLTGVAFLTGSVTQASFWLLETFPVLGKIGCGNSANKKPAPIRGGLCFSRPMNGELTIGLRSLAGRDLVRTCRPCPTCRTRSRWR